MKVVIVGARQSSEDIITPLVNKIVDSVKEKYSSLLVIVASCDKGVGRIIRSRNLVKQIDGQYEFDMLELQMKHYLHVELPRAEFTSHWNALNSTLVELGDEFHIITEEIPRGTTSDILRKIKEAGRPYAQYKPSEANGDVKHCS